MKTDSAGTAGPGRGRFRRAGDDRLELEALPAAAVAGSSVLVAPPTRHLVAIDGDDTRVDSDALARPRVSVVIPALNEARNIGLVLGRLPAEVDEVVVVDGDSVDDTVAVCHATRPGVRVVGQDRPGKGAALRAGFAAARGDAIIMIDADCSMDPAEMTLFLQQLDRGFDVVKGSRFLDGGGTDDMSRIRRWGNAALRGMVNRLYGADFSDLCYGYVAFRREALERLDLRADGFEIETEIIVRACNSKLRVGEVPSFEARRAHGDSNLRAFRDGRRVLSTLLRHRIASQRRPAGLEPAESAAQA